MRYKNTNYSDKAMVVNIEAHFRVAKSIIASAVVAFIAVSQASVSQASEGAKVKEVISVTATRTKKPVSEIANTVTVIDAEQIQKELANGIDDLVRYEPGVSVSGGGRFGLNSFSIRGIDGDRVLTLVDNTPTADEFSFGPFLSSRRDFVDLDALKTVEIVRGPGSSVYGSNAIGGVVNFITKDPVDYLNGETFAGSAKVGTSSVDSSINATVLTAFGSDVWSGMVVGTLRDSSETETYFSDSTIGSLRRAQNPQSNQNNNLYAKLVYAPNDENELSLVAERFDSDSETDVLSVAGTSSRGVLINSEIGIDQRSRNRFSIDYDLSLSSTFADAMDLLVYMQSSDALQNTLSERQSFGVIQDRVRVSAYEQENIGVKTQFDKVVDTDAGTHNIIYGFDYDTSESITLREGQTVNRVDGTLALEFSNFPTRDFPNSDYTSFGVFIQDEINFFEGRLSLIPAMRYDNFELNPTVDEVYLSGNTGSPTPEGYDESQVSAKLGIVYDIRDNLTIFAQYAEGFRAPALDAVNTGFTNFAGGYTTLPNPNLLPESGESGELGLRYINNHGRFEVVAYDNNYKNFIEALSVRGFNFGTGLLEFQAINLDGAKIQGLEFKAQYQLSVLSEALDGFQLRAAYAYAEGKNEETNKPLNSISPQELVIGLSYASQSDKWSIEAVVTAADEKNVFDIDASSLQADDQPVVMPFETPDFVTIDLIGHYELSDNATLNWGIFNLTDKQYYRWNEEFVQNPLTTNFDRLTEPGRNYSVTLKYDF